jgi:hypothetical protein
MIYVKEQEEKLLKRSKVTTEVKIVKQITEINDDADQK